LSLNEGREGAFANRAGAGHLTEFLHKTDERLEFEFLEETSNNPSNTFRSGACKSFDLLANFAGKTPFERAAL
jgi:hypothetical protein